MQRKKQSFVRSWDTVKYSALFIFFLSQVLVWEMEDGPFFMGALRKDSVDGL